MIRAVLAERGSALWGGLLGLALAVGVAEVVTRAEIVDPSYLPPASAVLAASVGLLLDPAFLGNVLTTLLAWAIGMAIAIAVAVPLGVVLGSFRRAEVAASTVVELLRPIPSVALIPIAILLLGRGLDMRIALVAYASSWPILLNAIYGVRDVDPVARDTARSFGLGRFEILTRVALPSAAPFVFTGIRISAAFALIVAISAELIAGGTGGIGVFMLEHTQTGVPREPLYAAIVIAGLLGVLLDAGLSWTERRLFAWHPRLRPAA